jgi:ectoine hydroxylase-related dioxygenase (phytanoyl-CoA dioxygenase family)
MKLHDRQIHHFHSKGFILIPNPLGDEVMNELTKIQKLIEPEWEKLSFPPGVNDLACQMLMGGEPVLRMVENESLLSHAKQIMDCDRVEVAAFGMGQTIKTVGKDKNQVAWHADDFGSVKQVAVRIAIDPHEGENAPLRMIPSSHLREREEVHEELLELELAGAPNQIPPEKLYVHHPQETSINLDPRLALLWTPNCWHSTHQKTSAGPRRVITWHYFAPGFSNPFQNAVLHMLEGEWQNWPQARQELWGLPPKE